MPSATAMSRSASASGVVAPRHSRAASSAIVATEVAVGVALGLRQLVVAGGLRAERDRDHPVPAPLLVQRQRALERVDSRLPGAASVAAVPRAAWRPASDDLNVNSSSSRLSAK